MRRRAMIRKGLAGAGRRPVRALQPRLPPNSCLALEASMGDEPEHARVPTNGINLHVARAGPEGGPLVLLLHGFPEPWLCWRQQIGPLAAAGYRVLAPDQRG